MRQFYCRIADFGNGVCAEWSKTCNPPLSDKIQRSSSIIVHGFLPTTYVVLCFQLSVLFTGKRAPVSHKQWYMAPPAQGSWDRALVPPPPTRKEEIRTGLWTWTPPPRLPSPKTDKCKERGSRSVGLLPEGFLVLNVSAQSFPLPSLPPIRSSLEMGKVSWCTWCPWICFQFR